MVVSLHEIVRNFLFLVCMVRAEAQIFSLALLIGHLAPTFDLSELFLVLLCLLLVTQYALELPNLPRLVLGLTLDSHRITLLILIFSGKL